MLRLIQKERLGARRRKVARRAKEGEVAGVAGASESRVSPMAQPF